MRSRSHIRRTASGLALLTAIFFPPLRAQTTIAWGAATTISGDADVSTTGTLIGAFSFTQTNTTTNPIVNGVTFASTPYNTTGTGASGFTTSFSAAANGNPNAFGQDYGSFAGPQAPYTNLSAAYQNLISAAEYSAVVSAGQLPLTGSLNLSGLSIGQAYQIQLWANDSRAGTTADTIGRTTIFGDGQGNNVTLAFNDGSTTAGGSLGQFVLGTFTAQSSSLNISLAPGPGGDGFSLQLAALEIRAIPEPSAGALLAGAAILGFVALRCRKRAPSS